MLDSPVATGETEIGNGVFATRSFDPGREVALVTGEVKDGEYSSDYCIDLRDGTVLEPQSPFRYLNHCCDPTCELIVWQFDDESIEVWLHAVTEIRKGDELTIDYAWPANAAIPCQCRSERCRGWIVAKEEVRLLSKARRPAPNPQSC